MRSIHQNAGFGQRRGNVVLCGKRITAGNRHFRPRIFHDQRQISRFSFQMNSHNNVFASERLRLRIFRFNFVQNRHEILHPRDFIMP